MLSLQIQFNLSPYQIQLSSKVIYFSKPTTAAALCISQNPMGPPSLPTRRGQAFTCGPMKYSGICGEDGAYRRFCLPRKYAEGSEGGREGLWEGWTC